MNIVESVGLMLIYVMIFRWRCMYFFLFGGSIFWRFGIREGFFFCCDGWIMWEEMCEMFRYFLWILIDFVNVCYCWELIKSVNDNFLRIVGGSEWLLIFKWFLGG